MSVLTSSAGVTFLRGVGFTDAEIEIRPLQVQDVYSREYASPNQLFRRISTGMVLVRSAWMNAAARSSPPLP